MSECDLGRSYRWAIIMGKFYVLIFKYIKLVRKWGLLWSLCGNGRLRAGNWPSHVKARKRTRTPSVLCGRALSDRGPEERGCERKSNSFRQLSTECFQQARFVFSSVAVKTVTLSFVFCAGAAATAGLGSGRPPFPFLFHFPLSSRPVN